jgi:hypothetical protein
MSNVGVASEQWSVLPFYDCNILFFSQKEEGAVKRGHHQVGCNVRAVRRVQVVLMRRRLS